MKLLYKPIGLLFGLIAGMASRQLFRALWDVVDKEEPPKPTTEQATWVRVIGAAVLQSAVFAGVRAATDRLGAQGFRHLTGVWPGEKQPEQK